MAYEIISFRRDDRSSETCSGNLIEAGRVARRAVKNGADRAEIRDAFGDLISEFPGIIRNA